MCMLLQVMSRSNVYLSLTLTAASTNSVTLFVCVCVCVFAGVQTGQCCQPHWQGFQWRYVDKYGWMGWLCKGHLLVVAYVMDTLRRGHSANINNLSNVSIANTFECTNKCRLSNIIVNATSLQAGQMGRPSVSIIWRLHCTHRNLLVYSDHNCLLTLAFEHIFFCTMCGLCCSGHYISDVYSVGDREWKTYNDSQVADTREEDVRQRRQCTGYIFFYMHR